MNYMGLKDSTILMKGANTPRTKGANTPLDRAFILRKLFNMIFFRSQSHQVLCLKLRLLQLPQLSPIHHEKEISHIMASDDEVNALFGSDTILGSSAPGGALNSGFQEPPAKRHGIGVDTQKTKIEESIALLMRNGLANAHQIRLLRAACIDAYLGQATSDMITDGLATTKSWTDRAKTYQTQDEKHQEIGFSHTVLFLSFVKTALKTQGDHRDELIKFMQQLKVDADQASSPYKGSLHHQLEHQVRLCKISRTHRKETRKIEITINSGTNAQKAMSYLHLYMLKNGFKALKGIAPKGEQERMMQEWIDQHM